MFLLITVLLSACEDFFISEAENIDIPGSKPQLVINSYISPQDTIVRVYVDRSRPYSQPDENYTPVGDNAEVFMARKGESFIKLEFNQQTMSFETHAEAIGIEQGHHYVLKVESFQGEKVEAECYVPFIEYKSIEIDPITREIDEWGTPYKIISWKITAAPNNEKKYYSTGAYSKKFEVQYWNNNDTVYIGTSPIALYKGKQYFYDDTGSSYSFRSHESYYEDIDNPDLFLDSNYVYLLQTDVNYYLFHKSIEDYYNSNDGSPFSEAVHIYSNIKGGLGVFAGYNRVDFVVPD